ncbi:MAG: hypothetical protein J6Z05_00905 [Lachnospiraceae bacterium]|nr:hypothetical protein [Lachnospiraceae bacterium]
MKKTLICLAIMLLMMTGCGKSRGEDWLSKQGYEITKKSAVKSFTSATYYQDREDETKSYSNGEVEIPIKVSIDETKEDCEEGRKKVILTTSLDLSVAGDDQLVWYISAFDRYSGTEFYAPTKKSNTFSLTVKNEKGDYDIESKLSGKIEDKLFIRTITVDCPEDYDGAVFEIGYGSVEMLNEFQNSEIQERERRIDETPFFPTNGHPYYFVSYDDK